ncbi:FkbM family methyltransferase [Metabacillus sp. HB246100]
MYLLPKPFVMKYLDRYPNTWKYVINLGLFLKYKTINGHRIPNKIALNSENSLYIDSAENRGRALLLKNGETQSRLIKFWKKSVLTFNPTIVLDIGVNYGECMFSTNYKSETIILGFEANKQLIPYIERSRSEHKNKKQMKIIHALASDRDDHKQDFFVNRMWSGTSSAIRAKNNKLMEKHSINSIRVDSIFEGKELSKERVLFKVDVEGFEAFVLNGMTDLIDKSKDCLGFIEFDSHYIRKSGSDLLTFLTFLDHHFDIYYYANNEQLIKMDQQFLKNFKKQLKTKDFHTDLVLMKK